ncbi:MAG: ribosome small subunit-dependent GTPase A, partial [Caldisericia bacterium]|nr:ribosome small subunit-dependent GTPase A [Caldisericia bacterium]
SHEKSVTCIAIGDYVECEIQEQANEDIAVIHEVYPPTTMIVRESIRYPNRNKIIASNLDQVFIVVAVSHPTTPVGMIDRITVAALSGGLVPILVFNKWDEKPTDQAVWAEMESIIRMYQPVFKVLTVSAKSGYHTDELKACMRLKKSIFMGNSGVGKSALVKVLTGIDLRLGEISTSSGKGKHTTRDSVLYLVEDNSWVADVPGIKQLGFIQTDDPIQYFPELYKASAKCKFSNCKHDQEPGCYVKECITNGTIDARRLESYQKLKDEIEPEYFKERSMPEEKRPPRARSTGRK